MRGPSRGRGTCGGVADGPALGLGKRAANLPGTPAPAGRSLQGHGAGGDEAARPDHRAEDTLVLNVGALAHLDGLGLSASRGTEAGLRIEDDVTDDGGVAGRP